MIKLKSFRLPVLISFVIGITLIALIPLIPSQNMFVGEAVAQSAPFQVPPLPYAYNALEPFIDAQTMKLHHDKHHLAYVNKLNAALSKYPNLKTKTVEELVRGLDTLPADIRTEVQNNGGGHINHTMFWEIMGAKTSKEPTGAIAQAINKDFGSFENFKQQFNKAGTERFGSGWAWLVRTDDKLRIISTPNQDSPLMTGSYPIIGNDVWEHAYYLKYQDRRADYLQAWWNVVNWDAINKRYAMAN